MDTQELLDRFRSEVHDTAEPQLWTDEEVVSYLDRSQRIYCREGGGIADSTSDATKINIVAGEPFGVLHPKVLKLRYVERESDHIEIDIWNFEDAQFRPMYDTISYTFPKRFAFDDTQGVVSKLVTGMEQGKVRWVYVPAADDTALCIVYRMPLETLSLENLCELEIPEEDHELLLDGMKALAYKKEDAETFDKSRQERHEAAFLTQCAESKYKREKREHKYRTVRYGGI
jgi:hypothetical protein